MKDKKYLFLVMIAFGLGMVYSLLALFQASSFSEIPGSIARAEKGFWLWILIGNLSFIGFIVCLYYLGGKEEKEPKAK